MIGYRRRCVEKGKPVGEHVGAAPLVGIAVGLLKISEGDPLPREGIVVLLAGGNLMMKISDRGIAVVAEGCGRKALLLLLHEL